MTQCPRSVNNRQPVKGTHTSVEQLANVMVKTGVASRARSMFSRPASTNLFNKDRTRRSRAELTRQPCQWWSSSMYLQNPSGR